MASINIDRLVEREENFTRYDGAVHRGIEICDTCPSKAGNKFRDVTDALRSRVDDGRLYLRVDNYSMGGDPLPGTHKMLRVLYVLDGERRNVVVDEKTDLRLP